MVTLDMRLLVSFDRRMNNCGMMIYLVLIDSSSLSASELQSLSKPVFWSGVDCSSTHLSLVDCYKDEYSGKTDDVKDVVITCKPCK